MIQLLYSTSRHLYTASLFKRYAKGNMKTASLVVISGKLVHRISLIGLNTSATRNSTTRDIFWSYWGKVINHQCLAGSACICKERTKCSMGELCFRLQKNVPSFVKTGMVNITGSPVGDDSFECQIIPFKGLIIKDETGRYFKESTDWDAKNTQ